MSYILPLTVWVYLHSNCPGGLRKTILFLIKWRFGRSRSSKVNDFGANQKPVCDFLLVRHSNHGPILHRFGDIAGFCAPDPPLFHPNFEGVPVAPDRLSYSAVKYFSKYSNLCDHGTWTSQTDGRTDRRTDDMLWHHRALRPVAW